ncbi:hypothetical protein C8Q75DRAFT_737530 [Abortiporus biennis]|nr:hypothetical protein C8Q75DRAFT_737530 [Abortiporus biennis]
MSSPSSDIPLTHSTTNHHSHTSGDSNPEPYKRTTSSSTISHREIKALPKRSGQNKTSSSTSGHGSGTDCNPGSLRPGIDLRAPAPKLDVNRDGPIFTLAAPIMQRYDIGQGIKTSVAFGGGAQQFPETGTNWAKIIHLDGSFYNFDTSSRLITPHNIWDFNTSQRINHLFHDEYKKIREYGPSGTLDMVLPKHCWLVIRDVDKFQPTVFWLDVENSSVIEIPLKGSGIDIVIEHKTERFWEEIERYPMHLGRLPRDAEGEFLSALSYGASERIIEENDTFFPFTDEQVQKLVDVYKQLKEEMSTKTVDERIIGTLSWHIARTMKKVEAARRRVNFGSANNSLYRQVVTAEPSWKVRLMETGLMVFMFGAHKVYRERLQSARVKDIVYLPDFRDLLRNLLAEWSDSNLLATVFVGANIAFLAVPDITTLQRTASLISAIFAVISVVTGVHHVWQHRTKIDATYADAQRYLSLSNSSLNDGHDTDLAITACFLAIPLVALLYAVLSFTVALGAFSVQSSDVHGKVLLSVIIGVLVSIGIVTVLFFWHTWRGPRLDEVSDEDGEEMERYGWKESLRRKRVVVVRMWKDLRDRVRFRNVEAIQDDDPVSQSDGSSSEQRSKKEHV